MRTLAVLLVLICCFPAAASAAARPDSDAPIGTTDPGWLPNEEWVMERWMPFDEERLFATIGLGRGEVYEYLKSGAGSLADLARRQHLRVTPARLLENRKPFVSKERYRTLEERTGRMLTQRHLAEHVIGHTWHRWSILNNRRAILGPQYPMLAAQGVRFEDLFLRVDVPRQTLRSRMLARMNAATLRGVRIGAVSSRQGALQQHQAAEFIVLLCPVS